MQAERTVPTFRYLAREDEWGISRPDHGLKGGPGHRGEDWQRKSLGVWRRYLENERDKKKV